MIENKVSTFRGGITIKIHYEDDREADQSYLGEYNDSWGPLAIDRFEGDPMRDRSQWRYFHPAVTLRDVQANRLYLRDHGYSKHEAYTMSRGMVFEQYNRMEALQNNDWHHVGLIAEVYYRGKQVEHSSLWAIESDCDPDCLMNNEYMESIQALQWVVSEPCYSEVAKQAARDAIGTIKAALYLAFRKYTRNYAMSRWAKCPKQSGYARWFDHNFKGEK